MEWGTLPRQEAYDALSQLSDFSLYQSWDFSQAMAQEVGGKADAVVVRRDGVLLGGAVLRIRTMPLTGWGVAYGLWAPIWQRPGAQHADLGTVLAAVREEYGRRRNLSVRLRPRIVWEDPNAAGIDALFHASGFHRVPDAVPAKTFLVDLRPSLEEIRCGFQRRWRSYLAQAERQGLELHTDGEDASFAVFLQLYKDMLRRKDFLSGVDPEIMRHINRHLPQSLKMEITLAYKEGRAIAGHVASHLGDTCLGLLAATSDAALDCHAANLVWWERLKRAKAAGLQWYDLGGYDYETNPKGAETKARLGGRPVTYIGEYRFEPSPLRAALVTRSERVYRWIKSIRRRKTLSGALGAACHVVSRQDEIEPGLNAMCRDIYARHGLVVRLVYLCVALLYWLITGAGFLCRRKAVVLCYHAVTDAQRARFHWQMRCIAKRVISVEQLSTRGMARRCTLLPVCVTFDDAFACLCDNALPILQQLCVRATVFVVTGKLGHPPSWDMPPGHPDAHQILMQAEQIRDAHRRSACRFGAHTVSHPALDAIPLSQALSEMAAAKASLEDLVGSPVFDLAIPFGAFNANVVSGAFALGYERVFTSDARCYRRSVGRGVIGRFSMSPDVWRIEFLLTVCGAYAWLGPWRRHLRWLRATLGARRRTSGRSARTSNGLPYASVRLPREAQQLNWLCLRYRESGRRAGSGKHEGV